MPYDATEYDPLAAQTRVSSETGDAITINNSLAPVLPAHLVSNPFFHFSEETHFIPAWDKIRPHHVMPAIEFILEKMRSDIESVASKKSKPTFKNTIEPINESFSLPIYFFLTLYNLLPKNKQEQELYDRLQEQAYLKFIDIFYNIFLEKDLEKRVNAAIYNTVQDKLQGNDKALKEEQTEQLSLLGAYQNTFRDFAGMSNRKKEKLKELEKTIAALSCHAQENMKHAEYAAGFFIDNSDCLEGLPDSLVQDARGKARDRGAPGKWFIGVEKEIFITVRALATDREVRRKMWHAYHQQAMKGPHNNQKTILELIHLQHEAARLQGYKNPAQQILKYRLVGTVKNAQGFLTDIKNFVKPLARKELKELKKYAQEQDGIEKFEPWDLHFYRERMQKEALGFDEEELKSYFELENVLGGAFRHFEKLYGLHFEETSEHPLPHPGVRSFNVSDAKTGRHRGVIFMDLYAREGKPAGRAWNISVVQQGLFEGKVRRPVDMVVTKFMKGTDGQPTLLSHEEVLIIFHELGHATHNVLGKCRYQCMSGTSVRQDFVEFPSQLNENWAYEPEVLDDFAFHYQTGEPIPDHMKQGIKKGREFMRGVEILELAQKGWLDLSWHTENIKNVTSVVAFEKAATRGFTILSNHNYSISAHFNHIFGGGYEAGFYSYQYAQAMEAAAFELFTEKGLYHKETAAKLRAILEKGGSRNEAALFKTLIPGDVTHKPLLQRAGLMTYDFDRTAKGFRIEYDGVYYELELEDGQQVKFENGQFVIVADEPTTQPA